MITGQITAVERSRSGKALRVQVNNWWYNSKNWDFEQMVGQTITFEPSVSMFQGKEQKWINDYHHGQAPATADQAFDQAMQTAQPATGPITAAAPAQATWQQTTPLTPEPAPMPAAAYQPPIETGHKNRDSSIVAQTLTKICCNPGDDPDLVWKIYTGFYAKHVAWDGSPVRDPLPESQTIPVTQANPMPETPAEMDDDIPF